MLGKKRTFLISRFTALTSVHKHKYKCLALTFRGWISLSSWSRVLRGPLTVFIYGIWWFRGCAERTWALTLIRLSFTMMLLYEFNYFGLHIKAVCLVATLRSRAWASTERHRKVHHVCIHIGCSIKTIEFIREEKF